MKKRVLVFLGTRPEALKLAPVIHALRRDPAFSVRTILTAQHREMLDQVLKLFRVSADLDLNLMTHDQSLASFSGRLFSSLEGVFKKYKPDLIMVQGDTATAFIVSLFAFYQKIPVAHVEAGLRTWDKYQPFPEEMNRRLISHVADFHLAPTREARKNLIKEGIPASRIAVTGNTVIDSLFWMKSRLKSRYPRLGRLNPSRRLVLVTAHRRESIGKPLAQIMKALRELVTLFPDLEVVLPVHLNPSVRKIVHQTLDGTPRIHLVPPLPYDETVYLMTKSHLILTDSGGIQEEAPSLGKPVLVLRQISERPEGIKAGALKVVGTQPRRVVGEAARLLKSKTAYGKMARVRHVYGDGKASSRIVKKLKEWLRSK